MHELSMAQGIINAVIETAENNNATEVNEVTCNGKSRAIKLYFGCFS